MRVARYCAVEDGTCKSCGRPGDGSKRVCAYSYGDTLGAGDEVSVVIPAHNYGEFLPQCLDSVLQQSRRPSTILVVDDASTDNTYQVAQEYARAGVQYLRIDEGSVWAARKAGYQETSSDFLLFLDADDWIGQDYLEKALQVMRDWRVGVVHSDLHRFGSEWGVWTYPDQVTIEDIRRDNQIHAGSLVRRYALDIAQPFQRRPPVEAHADWWMWRQVLSHGWIARKSPAAYHYRRHPGGSMIHRELRHNWFDRSAAKLEPVTLIIPLSGRREAWAELGDFLDRQTWPHDQIRLVLGDASQDPAFGDMIRVWARWCDYDDVRYRVLPAEAGLADKPREGDREVQRRVDVTMCRLWGLLAESATTPWTWTLEDDVIPPDDVLERLLTKMSPDVDAVSAPYRSRYGDFWIVMGDDDQPTGQRKNGANRAASCGFGCMVVRSELLRSHLFTSPGGRWYDPWFFESRGLKLVVDWECEAEHLGAVEEVL